LHRPFVKHSPISHELWVDRMHREGQPGTEVHLSQLYRDTIVRHARNPKGTMPIGTAQIQRDGYNPKCGDELLLRLRLKDGDTDPIIEAAQVEVHGCTICRASGSLLWPHLTGSRISECQTKLTRFREMFTDSNPDTALLEEAAILQSVAAFPARIDCALLPWTTVEAAFRAWSKP